MREMHIGDENIDIGRRTPLTVKKLEKEVVKRNTEKRGKKRGKRGTMAIKPFDFVAKEVVHQLEMSIISFIFKV